MVLLFSVGMIYLSQEKGKQNTNKKGVKNMSIHTQDDKMMDFKGTDFGDLVNQMNEEEFEAMHKWLLAYEYDYSFTTYEKAKRMIVEDYVKEWLIDQIANRHYIGMEHLYRLYRSQDFASRHRK